MDTISEKMMAVAESEMEKNGIEFKLDMNECSDTLYEELFYAMLNHVGKYTDTPIKYMGDWEVIIKAKDVQFEGGK
jgi:hypothetical protein